MANTILNHFLNLVFKHNRQYIWGWLPLKSIKKKRLMKPTNTNNPRLTLNYPGLINRMTYCTRAYVVNIAEQKIQFLI